MASYEDERSPRPSRELDNVEMQERDDSFDGEQDERLLADEDVEASGDLAYKVEWHLRPIWAVVGSIIAAGLVFTALVLFTKTFIVSDTAAEDLEMSGIGSFRRSPSDYILDPAWNFDAPRKVREYNWKITDIVANPDGVFRPMLTVRHLLFSITAKVGR
jgi:hypothetical protein